MPSSDYLAAKIHGLPPPPKILYDVVIGWVLIIVACLAFWTWIYMGFK